MAIVTSEVIIFGTMNTDSSLRKYAPFWNKYRPAILKMMQASVDEWKEYQFMPHELSSIEKKPKGGFSFRVVITMNKAVVETKDSEIAKDLIEMLRSSQTGSNLIATNKYEFVMGKNQLLRVSKQSVETT